jgi:hypothetical protein
VALWDCKGIRLVGIVVSSLLTTDNVVCETKLSVCKCEEEISCFGENVKPLKKD